MTIVHVLPAVVFGGFETLCLSMVRFSPSGFRHVVLNTESARADAVPMFRATGLEVHNCQFDFHRREDSTRRMHQALSGLNARGILVYRFGDQPWILDAANRAKVTRLAVHVGTHPTTPHYRWIREVVEAQRLAHIPLLFCSEAVEAHYRRISTPAKGSRTVYNGIDVDGIAATAEDTRSRKPPNELPGMAIGMVARVVDSKNHPLLLRAYKLARQQGLPQSELRIIGNGELLGQMQAEVARWEEPLRREVQFMGARTDVPHQLGRLDLFVFSVLPIEGCGNALMEAMAAGLPIVATDVPACREILGNTGLLTPPSSLGETYADAIKDLGPAAQKMAEAFLYLWRNPGQRAIFAAAAQKRALALYDAKRCCQQYLEALGVYP